MSFVGSAKHLLVDDRQSLPAERWTTKAAVAALVAFARRPCPRILRTKLQKTNYPTARSRAPVADAPQLGGDARGGLAPVEIIQAALAQGVQRVAQGRLAQHVAGGAPLTR